MSGDLAENSAGGPDFTVVIPTYNRASHVAPCLAPFLGDMARGLEVIVVDDGSTDDTQQQVEAAARQSRGASIRYVRQENAGPGAARNRGVGMARNDWVMFLDIDDRWFAWAIATIRRAIALSEQSGMIFLSSLKFESEAELVSAQDGPIVVEFRSSYYQVEDERLLPTLGTGVSGVRKTAFEKVGGFAPELRCEEDIDLFYRLALSGVLVVTAPALVACRVNSNDSLTNNLPLRLEGLMFMRSKLGEGRYPPPDDTLARLLDHRLILRIRIGFADGHFFMPYRYLFLDPMTLIRRRGLKLWLQLLLTPLLALVRPGVYRFPWRKAVYGAPA